MKLRRRLASLLVIAVLGVVGAAWASGGEARAVEEPPPAECDMVCTLQQIAYSISNGFEVLGGQMGEILGSGFDGVSQALENGFQHLEEGFEGLQIGISQLQSGFSQAVANGVQSIVNAIRGLQQLWEGLGDDLRSALDGLGDKIDRSVTPDPAIMTGLSDRIKSALGAPLDPWADALGSMASAWTASPAGCAGPALPIPYGPDQTYVMHPLSACEEPQATLAGIVRLAVSVVMISAAAWTVVRSIAAGLGYTE